MTEKKARKDLKKILDKHKDLRMIKTPSKIWDEDRGAGGEKGKKAEENKQLVTIK